MYRLLKLHFPQLPHLLQRIPPEQLCWLQNRNCRILRAFLLPEPQKLPRTIEGIDYLLVPADGMILVNGAPVSGHAPKGEEDPVQSVLREIRGEEQEDTAPWDEEDASPAPETAGEHLTAPETAEALPDGTAHERQDAQPSEDLQEDPEFRVESAPEDDFDFPPF